MTVRNFFEGDNFKCTIEYYSSFEEYEIVLIRKSDGCIVAQYTTGHIDDAMATAKRLWTNAETFKPTF